MQRLRLDELIKTNDIPIVEVKRLDSHNSSLMDQINNRNVVDAGSPPRTSLFTRQQITSEARRSNIDSSNMNSAERAQDEETKDPILTSHPKGKSMVDAKSPLSYEKQNKSGL